MLTLKDLPQPERERRGWPWTVETTGIPLLTWPRITIVTPSYNQGSFLEETIRSVLLQRYPNLQYLIIDGGSSDDSVSVIERYAHLIDYWVSEKDNGQTQAINKGFARADGAILSWLNSDDVLLPGALHRLATRAATSGVENSIWYGRRYRCDTAGRIFDFDLPPRRLRRWMLQIGSQLPQEATFFSRSLYESVGGLDESFRFAMDYDFWVRCWQHGATFNSLPYFLGAMRFHPSSKSMTLQEICDRESATIQRRFGGGPSENLLLRYVARANFHYRSRVERPLYRLFAQVPPSVYEVAERS